MKKLLTQAATVLLIAFVFFVVLVMVTRGQASSGGQFAIEKTVVAGGGKEKQTQATNENGTAGQAVAGHYSSGGQFSVLSGFWTPDAALVPTASPATVSGRILTADGRGITNVRVSLTSPTGETRAVLTSTFGYYRFADVESGSTYVMNVSSKRFTFAEPVRMVQVVENVADFNFTANPL